MLKQRPLETQALPNPKFSIKNEARRGREEFTLKEIRIKPQKEK